MINFYLVIEDDNFERVCDKNFITLKSCIDFLVAGNYTNVVISLYTSNIIGKDKWDDPVYSNPYRVTYFYWFDLYSIDEFYDKPFITLEFKCRNSSVIKTSKQIFTFRTLLTALSNGLYNNACFLNVKYANSIFKVVCEDNNAWDFAKTMLL